MNKQKFQKLVKNALVMRFYLFWKLPMAWFAGISIHSCTDRETVVRLPYSWRSQNPFRSIYFAAQCAAAELSTGLVALAHIQGKPPVSMLITKFEATFLKKAAAPLLFTCCDGDAIAAAIGKALQTGEAQEITALSTGTLPDGVLASEIKVTWSFKAK